MDEWVFNNRILNALASSSRTNTSLLTHDILTLDVTCSDLRIRRPLNLRCSMPNTASINEAQNVSIKRVLVKCRTVIEQHNVNVWPNSHVPYFSRRQRPWITWQKLPSCNERNDSTGFKLKHNHNRQQSRREISYVKSSAQISICRMQAWQTTTCFYRPIPPRHTRSRDVDLNDVRNHFHARFKKTKYLWAAPVRDRRSHVTI